MCNLRQLPRAPIAFQSQKEHLSATVSSFPLTPLLFLSWLYFSNMSFPLSSTLSSSWLVPLFLPPLLLLCSYFPSLSLSLSPARLPFCLFPWLLFTCRFLSFNWSLLDSSSSSLDLSSPSPVTVCSPPSEPVLLPPPTSPLISFSLTHPFCSAQPHISSALLSTPTFSVLQRRFLLPLCSLFFSPYSDEDFVFNWFRTTGSE